MNGERATGGLSPEPAPTSRLFHVTSPFVWTRVTYLPKNATNCGSPRRQSKDSRSSLRTSETLSGYTGPLNISATWTPAKWDLNESQSLLKASSTLGTSLQNYRASQIFSLGPSTKP